MYHKPANVQTPDPGAKRQFLRVHLPAVKLVSSFQGNVSFILFKRLILSKKWAHSASYHVWSLHLQVGMISFKDDCKGLVTPLR